MDIHINSVCDIAVQAGDSILNIYAKTFDVEFKEDQSPLTEADRVSHRIISEELLRLYPDIPVLSEEGKDIPFVERKTWDRFWLVDPLDGTKEFIKRNGEFTVNIALIENNRPAAGVIYVPVQHLLYYASRKEGAWKKNGGDESVRIHVRNPDGDGLVVVQSRSHPSEELQRYLEKLNIRERIARGSSLKFCAVAEGSADLYPRLGPTWEWDTAAGHAIVEAAGGHVVDLKKVPIGYNKKIIKHEHFIAVSDLSLMG